MRDKYLRVEDFIKFGRRLAERWPAMGLSDYESKREARAVILYEIEQHLGIDLSPFTNAQPAHRRSGRQMPDPMRR